MWILCLRARAKTIEVILKRALNKADTVKPMLTLRRLSAVADQEERQQNRIAYVQLVEVYCRSGVLSKGASPLKKRYGVTG